MKRSELNRIVRDSLDFIDELNFKLPPFAYFTYEDWKTKGGEYAEIPDNIIGWDITDFGSGDFGKVGLVILTTRNGSNNAKYPKSYGEKLMICEIGQVTPYHQHGRKLEDIINRGGGTFVFKCFKRDAEGNILKDPFSIAIDGRRVMINPEERVELQPGESVFFEPGVYHTFWAENGKTLVGEVADYEDYEEADAADFHEEFDLSMKIEEDEPILYPLFTEYPDSIKSK